VAVNPHYPDVVTGSERLPKVVQVNAGVPDRKTPDRRLPWIS